MRKQNGRAAGRRSEAERAARRRAIRDAATPLFVAHGFSATSMDAVARAAEVAHGTVFLYFPTKEDLFRAAVLEPLTELEGHFRVAGDDDSPVRERLARMAHDHVRTVVGRSEYLRLVLYVLGQRDRFPELARTLTTFAERNVRDLVGLIEEGQRSGEVASGDAQVIALAYFSFLQGLTVTLARAVPGPMRDGLAAAGFRILAQHGGVA